MTKTVTKPAVKAAPKTAPVATSKAAMKEVVKTLHIITDIARPQSGPRLFAHTVAALTVLGMFSKGHPAVLRTALQALIGGTAIRYHTKVKGNLLEQGDRIALSEPGVGFFKSRTYDKAEEQAFESLFKTGDGAAAKIRPQHIVPVSVAI